MKMRKKRPEVYDLKVSIVCKDIFYDVDNIADLRIWQLDRQTGEVKDITKEIRFNIEFVAPRPERCQLCECIYPRCEMVVRGDKHLCLSCDQDIVKPEDVPF
jgi:hypothetical protein